MSGPRSECNEVAIPWTPGGHSTTDVHIGRRPIASGRGRTPPDRDSVSTTRVRRLRHGGFGTEAVADRRRTGRCSNPMGAT